MLGDQSLFLRTDGLMAAWEFFDPLLAAWAGPDPIPLHPYPAGGWGPAAADELLLRDGRQWRTP
jgi:glucose-6-phosphate 1-dehydrogenase